MVFAPFGGDRRFFGMVSVLSVRAIAVLSILMGNYFVLLQFPSETLQDMFWPFTAFIYKSVTSNMVHLIWNLGGPSPTVWGRIPCTTRFPMYRI